MNTEADMRIASTQVILPVKERQSRVIGIKNRSPVFEEMFSTTGEKQDPCGAFKSFFHGV